MLLLLILGLASAEASRFIFIDNHDYTDDGGDNLDNAMIKLQFLNFRCDHREPRGLGSVQKVS